MIDWLVKEEMTATSRFSPAERVEELKKYKIWSLKESIKEE